MGQADSKLKGSFTFAYLKDWEHLPHEMTRLIEENSDYSAKDTPRLDNILIYPELYGLGVPLLSSKADDRNNIPLSTPAPSSVQMISFNDIATSKSENSSSSSSSSNSSSSSDSETSAIEKRPDSGYASSPDRREALRLANDVAYIDRTYYPSLRFDPYTATKTIESSAATSAAETEAVKNNEEIEKDGIQDGINESGVKFSIADVVSASPDKTIREVHLSNRSICQLNANMGMLTTIRKLDLSSNRLTELPESIGCMRNLEVLNVSRNRLRHIPDTIGYLSNLAELDLSYNKLVYITPCVGYLDKLKTLSLAFNQISRLPTNVEGLINLINLDLTRNPLQVLPAEVAKLPFLRRMRLDDCPLNSEMSYSLKHSPPSLVEICARNIVRNKAIDVRNNRRPTLHLQLLPQHLLNYIHSAKRCSSCRGPYFESYVLRGRLMEKADVYIPLEYTLCSAHWSDCDDRILSMFSAQPESSSDNVPLPARPILPNIPSAGERRSVFNRHHRQSNTSATSSITANVTSQTSATNTTVLEDSLALVTSTGYQQRVRFATTTKLRSNNNNGANKRFSSLGRLTSRMRRSNNFS